jgi:hypothetical protein
MAGSIRNIVLACPGHGRELASFYAELLGMKIIREDWVKIATNADADLQLAFGDGPGDYQPPRWPDPEYPQQLHLDLFVPDLERADARAIRLGATRLQDKGQYRSYSDLVGHPFCLCSPGQ